MKLWHSSPRTHMMEACGADPSNPLSTGCPYNGNGEVIHLNAPDRASANRMLEADLAKKNDPFGSVTPITKAADTLVSTVTSASNAISGANEIVDSWGWRGNTGSDRIKRMTAVGGVLIAAYSLAACSDSSIAANASEVTSGGAYVSEVGSSRYIPENGGVAVQAGKAGTARAGEAIDRNPVTKAGKAEAERVIKEIDQASLRDDLKKAATNAKNKAGETIKKGAENLPGAVKKVEEGIDRIKLPNVPVPTVTPKTGTGNGTKPNYKNPTFDRTGKARSQDVLFQGKPINISQREVDEAKAALARLTVAPERETVKYDRGSQYGRAFNTGVVGRTERRDVTNGTFKNASPQARATGGWFVDPYSGKKQSVSTRDNADTDVDHLVSLKEANQSGAMSKLTASQRKALANDPDNLAIVSSRENRSKSDGDIADWAVPSYTPAAKALAVRQIKVKKKYNLNVDAREKSALLRILNSR